MYSTHTQYLYLIHIHIIIAWYDYELKLRAIKTASERQGDSNRYDYYKTEKDAEDNKHNSKYGQCNFSTLQTERVHSVGCQVCECEV